ncbi:hypothetical protein [Ferruginibacter sp.]|nr:hypothetical protein [Ferruginibacter sp.]
MKKQLLVLLMAITTSTFFSCQKVSPVELDNNDGKIGFDINKVDTENCPATTVTLVAGQHIDAGTVSVTNDANYIYVTYTTANGYLLTQTHLFVGACNLVPVNNQGNPVPGQFPYANTHNNITSYTYQLPVSAIGLGNCGCIAAHAVVVKLNESGQVIEQQTGWGNGIRINPNGGNWGMKFNFCTCVIDL